METATQLPKIQIVDGQCNPLIPQDELPFMHYFTRGKARYFGSHWKVDAPAHYEDAERLGQEMALAFLRMAPEGAGDRGAAMSRFTTWLLSAQAKRMSPAELRALAKRQAKRRALT